MGYYGFDLDGTLVKDKPWRGPRHIGQPVPAMLEEAKWHLSVGHEIRLITARVASINDPADVAAFREAWAAWALHWLGCVPISQAEKDYNMIAQYDDRSIAVERNTGRLLSPRLP